MKYIKNPKKDNWFGLIQRPLINNQDITLTVKTILDKVRVEGDMALYELTNQFDKIALKSLPVSSSEFDSATDIVSEELKAAIDLAYHNITAFHKTQKEEIQYVETISGVTCWRKSVAIEKVGLYIPGGSAPLFSTILMLAIPAQIAGCKELVLCTPPDNNGNINPAILYTAKLVGIKHVYKVGGAQAIAAMAYGTETLPKVYKIFGPGNQFVTKAKELIQQDGVAIDMPAGPSEVLVVADSSCIPKYVAADLLSQAEHGSDSQVILLSDSESVIQSINQELTIQLELLPRKTLAQQSLSNSKAILLESIESCMKFSNYYAPEHLIIASSNAERYADLVINAGSVFLGNFSCESAGDYASGTNHTLPTNGFARNYSGVSVDSFVKKITFQNITSQGIKNIGPSIEIMAEAEQLFAHKNAVSFRLNDLKDE